MEVVFNSGRKPVEISISGDREGKILNCSWAKIRDGENVLVIQDVTQLRSLQRRMQKSERLTAMGEMALELAHEIRNPLAGLELFTSLLQEDGLSVEEHDRYLSNVQVGIRSLNAVVSNMLCFSRQLEPLREPVEMAQLMEEVASWMAPLLEQGHIRLSQEYEDRRTVWVDREMLRQVFTNLLLNAMQALPQGGQIKLQTLPQQGRVAAVVSDDGLGIPKQFHEAIFDPYFSASAKGQGLGLAIVKRIVDTHAGEIRLKSQSSRGTQFTLLFMAGDPKA